MDRGAQAGCMPGNVALGHLGAGSISEAAELFSSTNYLWVEGTHSALGSG